MTCARRKLRLPEGSLTVALVTNAEIARWNRAYRRKDGPTDVLSFPVETEGAYRRKRASSRGKRNPLDIDAGSSGSPQTPHAYLGDIAIAPAVARQNARRFGRTFCQEMRILMLHGMLHLMGYDHETDTGQMERREKRLRRQLGLG